LGLAFATLLGEVRAQEEVPKPPTSPALDGSAAPRVVRLPECIETALANNLNLKAEELRTRSSILSVMASKGIFDPVLFSDGMYVEYESPTVNVLETGETQAGVVKGSQMILDAGLRQRLFTGLTAELRWNQRREDTERAFVALNPSYSANLGLTVTQPLLKGGWDDANLSEIRIAEKNVEISASQYRLAIEDLVLQVIEAFWELNFREQDLRVKQESLDLAINERNITESKVRSGLWAQLELDQAWTEEYSRRAELEVAKRDLGNAKDSLRMLMFPMDDPRQWTIELQTPDELKEVDLDEKPERIEEVRSRLPNWEECAQIAMQERPEIIQARLELENRETEIRSARNDELPTLDLSGGYAWNVLGEKFSDNYSDAWFSDERTWNAGLAFEFPIGNRAARAALSQAKLDLRRSRILLKDTENRAVAEVREAIRTTDAAIGAIEFSQKALVSARKQLSAAQSRRDRGFLTNFEVLQFQRDLSQAEQNVNAAWKEYRLACARLEKAKGTLTLEDESGIAVPIVGP